MSVNKSIKTQRRSNNRAHNYSLRLQQIINESSAINLHTNCLDNHLISLSFQLLREPYWAFENTDPHLSLCDRQQLNDYLRKESTDKLTAKFLLVAANLGNKHFQEMLFLINNLKNNLINNLKIDSIYSRQSSTYYFTLL